MPSHRPYHLINLLLAGTILLVFVYSGTFNAEAERHPVPSFFEEITRQPAPSSGMSRAFSELIRGKIRSAREYNADSPMIFLFFLIQLIQRIGVSLFLRHGILQMRYLLLADVMLSLLLFLFSFRNQIDAMVNLTRGTEAFFTVIHGLSLPI